MARATSTSETHSVASLRVIVSEFRTLCDNLAKVADQMELHGITKLEIFGKSSLQMARDRFPTFVKEAGDALFNATMQSSQPENSSNHRSRPAMKQRKKA